MATFILVHGAWHGAWCWREIVPQLEREGHRALAIDLPGHGEDPTPREEVTLQYYVDRVIRAVELVDDPPILVGHSMGGVLIGQVAEAIPNRIQALVAVASIVPPDGLPMMNGVEQTDPKYLAHLQWAPDRRTAGIAPQGVQEYLYQQCAPEIVEDVISRLTPEPVAPFTTPIRTTSDRSASVPRYYVGCLQDRVVAPDVQQRMCATLPPNRTYRIDADHAPFFSAPAALIECLTATIF
jgi:pimeloyl-ACP methyl ester carboxylesterase